MEYFKISDKYYNRINYYTKRNPPWIKLNNDFLEDYEFANLSDQLKYHFIALLLLSSRSENNLPWDRVWIGKKINSSSVINLDKLWEKNFILKINELGECMQHACNMHATCMQDACNMHALGEERRGEGEGEREREREREKRNTICSEPKKLGSDQVVKFIDVQLILNDKSLYIPTQEEVDHWIKLYAGVKVFTELKKMQGWLESHPTKRKTKRGIKSFITSWLSRAQDKSFRKNY